MGKNGGGNGFPKGKYEVYHTGSRGGVAHVAAEVKQKIATKTPHLPSGSNNSRMEAPSLYVNVDGKQSLTPQAAALENAWAAQLQTPFASQLPAHVMMSGPGPRDVVLKGNVPDGIVDLSPEGIREQHHRVDQGEKVRLAPASAGKESDSNPEAETTRAGGSAQKSIKLGNGPSKLDFVIFNKGSVPSGQAATTLGCTALMGTAALYAVPSLSLALPSGGTSTVGLAPAAVYAVAGGVCYVGVYLWPNASASSPSRSGAPLPGQ